MTKYVDINCERCGKFVGKNGRYSVVEDVYWEGMNDTRRVFTTVI